jgi:DNA topoisomerase I
MSKLLIVESPTKAKTIKKFFGSTYEVISSYGHIRDLPRKEMGIDFEKNFTPKYVVADDKKQRVADLKRLAKKVDEVYLATDEDREGEAISWHIAEVLGLDPAKAKRITFHEITKHAIEHALENPRTIDMSLVNAQQARRILDRIVGYELSPFLWKKVQRGLSAGRVQSIAVRMVVEREREREAFKSDEYWTVDGMFGEADKSVPGKLVQRDGKKIKKLDIKTDEEANGIVALLKGANFTVSAIEKKHANKKAPTPLKTSTLQQEANNKLHFSAKQTMTLAQKLYETGRITYMRTDSLNLSEKFLGEAQAFLMTTFGGDYATGKIAHKTKGKGAQEAHEAIRPTDVNLTPEMLQGKIDQGQWKLYDMIWRRTLASQMPAAKIERTAVDLEAKAHIFRANGSIILFDGFMKVYKNSKEKILPDLEKGQAIEAQSIEAKQHFTEPAARFSDAMLIKELEEHGIGRPSTYAPTISTIIDRGYIDRDDNKKLFPNDIAGIVNDVLVEHFSNIVNFEFTADLERTLDEIAEGKVDWVPMLEAFYGPFHKTIEEKTKDVSREDIIPTRELGIDPKTGLMITLRFGRFGSYVQLGEWSEEDRKAKKNKPRMASLHDDVKPDDATVADALEVLAFPKELGKNEEGEIVTVNFGPYGPYIKIGKKNSSVPEGVNPTKITLADAFEIAKNAEAEKKKRNEPIQKLGEDPNSKGELLIKTGRFGPYATDGTTNASLGKKFDAKTITREETIELLEKKRNSPKRGWGKKKKK